MPPNIARDLVPLADLESSLYRHLYPFDLDPAAHQSPPPVPALAMAASPRESPSSLSPPPLSHSDASSKASSTPEARTPPPAPDSSAAEDSASLYDCQWQDCDKVFPEPETLYNHLCNDHIGRKSTGNLCLTCKWKDCSTSCAKRDHITSHLRVHTPLKPHVCVICKKSFKRPQDLKKHEKIHTEEHHAQHKHSKAITVSDPAYASRVRGEPSTDQKKEGVLAHLVALQGMDKHQVPVARAKSNSLSVSERSSGPDYGGLLATPSPEIEQAAIRYPSSDAPSSRTQHYQMHNPQLPTWEVLTVDGAPSRSTGGAKRTHDEYSVDDFFTDVKKRRVNPSYDTHMAARLNTLAYQPTATGPAASSTSQTGFNPRSVSFDIRSPEELAAVNEFLITLGRDVANTAPRITHHPPPAAETHPGSFFDAASLSQLGLAGMPGIPAVPGPGSGVGYHGDSGYLSVDFSSNHLPPVYPSRSSHQSVQPMHFSAHPAMHEQPISYASHYTRIRGQRMSHDLDDDAHSRHLHRQQQQGHYAHMQPHYFTSQLDGMSNPGASPLSTASTPSSGTPPHLSETVSVFNPDGTGTFDYLLPSKAAPPVQLAAMDFGGKNMRSPPLLRTAPGTVSKAAPIEPRLRTTVHRGPPAKLTQKDVAELGTSLSRPPVPSSSSPTLPPLGRDGSLYPLLTSGDEQYKLPPMMTRYRSPSPPASVLASSPMLSRASTLSPTPYESSRPSTASSSSSPSPRPTTVLPGIHEIAEGASRSKPRRRDSDDLVRAIGQIELESRRPARDDPAQREAHAQLVKDLLVSINMEYRRKFGTPPPDLRRMRVHAELRDVEMVGA
ncbi:hypothetical protein DAEQUDRAFT_13910 [Daedalea quercina L-15889]|uniref:C2H2-type domain-containing protein n=1 Tax=Daedalea quercina L-15889 TaxID=1314783 RepID=A0A165UHZ1_9APHY|nr:hypothetical protein DAEQUDRAFT_13910 [Daedalea quercina L-15889]